MVFGFETKVELVSAEWRQVIIGGWENETWAFLLPHRRHVDTQPKQQDEHTLRLFGSYHDAPCRCSLPRKEMVARISSKLHLPLFPAWQ
jgi:hypothetical protein